MRLMKLIRSFVSVRRSSPRFFQLSMAEETPLEQIENIEIRRLLESDIPVSMVEVPSGTIAVDVPEDVLKVESFLKPFL